MDIGTPVQMTIRKHPYHLHITRTWFQMKYLLFTPFVIIWDAFVFWGYKTTFSTQKVDWLVVLFMLLHLFLSVALTYGLLAGFLNKTTIDVTPNVISVKHSPLPLGGNWRISSKEISQLECKKEYPRKGLFWIPIISIVAKKNKQETITLLTGLKTIEQAIFLKKEIEVFLRGEHDAQ